MTRRMEQLAKLFFLTLMGALGAMLAGLIRYGGTIFMFSDPGFLFVSFGISGALMFAFYHLRGVSEAITASVIMSAVQFMTTTHWTNETAGLIWSFGVNTPALLLVYLFEKRFSLSRQLKTIVVASGYALILGFLTMTIMAIQQTESLAGFVIMQNCIDGFLLGLGLVAGITAGEMLLDALDHHATAIARKHTYHHS